MWKQGAMAEHLQALQDKTRTELSAMVQEVQEAEEWGETGSEVRAGSIYKKGDPRWRANNRPISLLNAM